MARVFSPTPNVGGGMIDLHCHVLPGIDDGPATIQEALALAGMASAAGIRRIVATPHVSWRYPNDAETVRRLTAELNDRLAQADTEIDVIAGAEIAMTRVPDTPFEELEGLTLGSSRWLLLEPPFAPVAHGLDAIAIDLMQKGFKVLIAHPERCAALQREPSLLGTLVRAGALTSITAGSLSGRFGGQARRFALQMLEEEIAHNVASDAHDTAQRPPAIQSEIDQAGYRDLTDWLTELVPAAILADQEPPPRPSHARPGSARRRGLLSRLRGA